MYRVVGPSQISAQTEWKESTELEFVITKTGEVIILQERKIIVSQTVDLTVSGCIVDDLQFGTGIYGNSNIDIEHTIIPKP